MTANEKISLTLADDHILLRDALSNLINSFDRFRVIDNVSNGQQLVDSVKGGKVPDIVLLDLNMPVMDGYEVTRWLNDHYPEVKIIILTMYDSDIALIRLLQEGVRGFLKKDIHPDELLYALTTLQDQGYYYPHRTSGKIAALFKKGKTEPGGLSKGMLTETEILFLKMASTDMTYKEIAVKMNMSTRVVDNYRENLFEKLDVRSRVGLAVYAIKNGIVTF